MRERELANSLRVGPEKPLGSQGGLWGPVLLRLAPTIWRYRRTRNLGLWVSPSGFVYMWDVPAMRHLLRERCDVLRAADWPEESADFVRRLSTDQIEPLTVLFDLAADAYGDRTGPGRTDVLPGVDRVALFRAYYDMHGYNDPTLSFFDDALLGKVVNATTGKHLRGVRRGT